MNVNSATELLTPCERRKRAIAYVVMVLCSVSADTLLCCAFLLPGCECRMDTTWSESVWSSLAAARLPRLRSMYPDMSSIDGSMTFNAPILVASIYGEDRYRIESECGYDHGQDCKNGKID